MRLGRLRRLRLELDLEPSHESVAGGRHHLQSRRWNTLYRLAQARARARLPGTAEVHPVLCGDRMSAAIGKTPCCRELRAALPTVRRRQAEGRGRRASGSPPRKGTSMIA